MISCNNFARWSTHWQQPPGFGLAHVRSRVLLQEDTLVRALRFMDTLLQRDNLQKAAFLKDLTSFWPRFDARILCHKVGSAFRVPLHDCRQDAASQSAAMPSMLQVKLDRRSASIACVSGATGVAGGATQ